MPLDEMPLAPEQGVKPEARPGLEHAKGPVVAEKGAEVQDLCAGGVEDDVVVEEAVADFGFD